METTLYLLSLILQVCAVAFAVRMARRSVLRSPWFVMAAALGVMTAFRVVGLLSSGRPPIVSLDEHAFRLFTAGITPIISALLFLSLFAIRRLTLVHESAEAARIAAEQRQRESDLRLRAIFDQTRNFLGVLANDGTVLDLNPAPFRSTGFPREDVIGKPLWHAPWYGDPDEVRRGVQAGLAQAIETGAPVRQETPFFLKDGSRRFAERTITPVKDEAAGDGRVLYCIVETRDVTDRKRNEEELIRAKQQAEDANAAKDQFLAVLSHELRTPLTPVLLMVSMLEKQPELSQAVRDEVAMIRRNVEMEARLIDDLLDLTKITRGVLQLNVETADLHVLIRTAVDICCGPGNAAGPVTTLDFHATRHVVRGDPARLQQVFWNLINNAKKFTPAGDAGGRITISTADAREGFVRIDVTDTGQGIAPDVLPKVFKAFEQGGPNARRFGGLGLGLAICKALVELHDGTITAHSDGPGAGARFTVELPVLALAAPPAPSPVTTPAAAATSGPGPLRILLVEDHEDTAKMMRKLLGRLGHDVRAANNAKDAEAFWRDEPFDLVISDLGLPDATGHELLLRLQTHRPVKGIAVSGFGMAEDLQRSADAGFTAHVTKPLDMNRLKAAIAAACDTKSAV